MNKRTKINKVSHAVQLKCLNGERDQLTTLAFRFGEEPSCPTM